MAPNQPSEKYQYVLTAQGPKIIPVPEAHSRDEESPADYNQGGYLQVKVRDTFKDGRYTVLRKLGYVLQSQLPDVFSGQVRPVAAICQTHFPLSLPLHQY